MLQLMLRMCQSILLGERGAPISLKIIMCCSNSHMRHQSLAQPVIHEKYNLILKKKYAFEENRNYCLSEKIEREWKYRIVNVIHKANKRQEAL
jgi:hypothetical protein